MSRPLAPKILPPVCLVLLGAMACSPAPVPGAGAGSTPGVGGDTLPGGPARSFAEIHARIDAARPGDVVVVPDGEYRLDGAVVVTSRGTADAPVRITAATPGGVTLTGPGGFEVKAPAEYVEIVGFVFADAAGSTRIEPGAVHIRFSRNVFRASGKGAYLTIAGDDAEVDHNDFGDKRTVGNMIDVRGAGSQVAQHVHIHHNYFHDFSDAGANGAETIRFGLSGLSLSKGDGLIEHNLFLRCTGENELISVKSGSNVLRYNTFLDSPGAQLTLRHGNENLVYGNYFRGTDGIRVFGDRHRVFSNYLEENTGAIDIGNGDGEVADGAKLTSHDRPDDDVIVFNTLVNNRRNYYMTGRTNGLGATGTVFADNVIVGGGPAATLDGPYTSGVWAGNIVWQTEGAGDMPGSGLEAVDPRLARGAGGLLRPGPGSPAVDSASGEYPAVTVDVDGQPREAPLDRGADEISAAPVVFTPLTPADGPGLVAGGS